MASREMCRIAANSHIPLFISFDRTLLLQYQLSHCQGRRQFGCIYHHKLALYPGRNRHRPIPIVYYLGQALFLISQQPFVKSVSYHKSDNFHLFRECFYCNVPRDYAIIHRVKSRQIATKKYGWRTGLYDVVHRLQGNNLLYLQQKYKTKGNEGVLHKATCTSVVLI